MSIEEHLDELERTVHQYEVDWRRFFGGSIDTPPDDLGESLVVRIRNLYQSLGVSTVDRFRLRTLEGRFNAVREHFRRTLREAELSGSRKLPTPGASAEVKMDPSTPLEETEALYETLFANKEKPIEHQAFHRFLLKEAERIRTRTQAESVVYFLEREDRRYKLRARTISKSEQ